MIQDYQALKTHFDAADECQQLGDVYYRFDLKIRVGN